MSIEEVLAARSTAHHRVIQSLGHLDRNAAMNIILSWLSIKEVESIALFQEQKNGEWNESHPD